MPYFENLDLVWDILNKYAEWLVTKEKVFSKYNKKEDMVKLRPKN